jgi:hypothetical protein
MRSPGFMREVTAGIIAGLLTPLVLIAASFFVKHHAERYWLLGGALAAAVTTNGYLLYHRPRRFLSRHEFMGANLAAIERENDGYRATAASRVATTRFSSWHLAEVSEERAKLRHANDRAAEVGVSLKRIHILRTDADRRKILYEIEKYRAHRNASIRLISHVDPRLIPELTITTRWAAIGPSAGDGIMAFGFAYRDRPSVEALQQYYDALWELAAPVMENGEVIDEMVVGIEQWSPRTPEEENV